MKYILIVIAVIACFILFNILGDGFEWYIFGCGRKFDNGRKCSVFHCPNRKNCQFSEYRESEEKSDEEKEGN